MTAYKKLESTFSRLSNLNSINGILQWDQAVMMQDGSNDVRAEQLSTISSICHEMLSQKSIGDLIQEATQDATLNEWQKANLRQMKHEWIHATAVETKLVAAHVEASTKTEMIWREARANNNYKLLKPHLENLLELSRKIGQSKASVLNCSAYEALLDSYDQGRKTAEIDAIFNSYAQFLPGFLSQVQDAQAKRGNLLPLTGPFPVEKQKDLGLRLMKQVGFDFTRGRLDQSTHPFCGGSSQDIRITTRYNEDNYAESLMGVLHETGHAMYELNLPKAWLSQPVGNNLGMSIHESQSLLVEMVACRSREFLSYITPLIKETFGKSGPAWETENIYRKSTFVEPSFIRVNADQVTYPAHVILRYRLEKQMIEGDLNLDDLPEAWNVQMQSLLGITPPNDQMGCLQDIHWPSGGFGYFPTYTLGAMIAVQLFDAAKKAHPTLLNDLNRGDFTNLMTWVKTNVHENGSFLSANDLIIKATGQSLNPEIFKNHLKDRYL